MKKRTPNPFSPLWFRCVACGTCCHEGLPVITDADARRIMKATGLPVEEAVALVADRAIEFPKSAPDWVVTDRGPRVLTVRRRGGKCVFLGADGHCSIYEARPDTCRLYPYAWELDAKGRVRRLSFISGIRCRRERDATIDLAAYSALARQEDATFDAYAFKVQIWNEDQQRRVRAGRRAETAREFLRFMGLLGT